MLSKFIYFLVTLSQYIRGFFSRRMKIMAERMERKALGGFLRDDFHNKCRELERKLEEKKKEMHFYSATCFKILNKSDAEIEKLKMNHEKILSEKFLLLDQNRKEIHDLEGNLKKLKMDKERIHVAQVKLINKKEEDLERLKKEKNVLEEKAKKTDNLEKQLKEIQKEMTKKNEENEKMKKTNQKLIKAKEEEIERLKKQQNQEIKEKQKDIDRLKVDNIHDFNEKLNLKLMIKQKEETEVQLRQEIKELTENHHLLDRNQSHFEMKTAIKLKLLGEEVLEKDRVIRELQESKLPTPPMSSGSSTSSEISSEFPSSSGAASPTLYSLKDLKNERDTLDIDSLLEKALKRTSRLISISNQPEIHKMANEEYQKYEEGLKKYQRAIEMNIQLLECPENVGFAIPIPHFPAFSNRFTAEYWAAIHEQHAFH